MAKIDDVSEAIGQLRSDSRDQRTMMKNGFAQIDDKLNSVIRRLDITNGNIKKNSDGVNKNSEKINKIYYTGAGILITITAIWTFIKYFL